MAIPKYDQLLDPLFQAIKRLGGSASIPEMNEEVISNLSLTEKEIAELHDERQTKLEYRLAWGRSYLKIYGVLDNSERGIWVITAQGKEIDTIDPYKVRQKAQQAFKERRKSQLSKQQNLDGAIPAPLREGDQGESLGVPDWREVLIAILYELSPDAFERLCQRLLRESGFVEVKVTGRVGDGGIDGVGIIRIGGLLGFPVLFQCKRYRGSVSSSAISDFRGAMIGRTDRGLFITTGTFTRDARIEATRDGAPPIDLVDGDQLLDKLKELGLGVSIKMVEEVSVTPEWFKGI